MNRMTRTRAPALLAFMAGIALITTPPPEARAAALGECGGQTESICVTAPGICGDPAEQSHACIEECGEGWHADDCDEGGVHPPCSEGEARILCHRDL